MLVTAGSKMKNDVIDVMIARQANVQRTSTSAIPKGKYEIIIMTTFFKFGVVFSTRPINANQ